MSAHPVTATTSPSVGQFASIDANRLIDESTVTRFQVLVGVLGGLILFLDGFDTQVIGYIAPAIFKAWSVPIGLRGWIFSSGLVGLLLGYLALSPLAARHGHKRMVVGCLLAFGALTIMTTLAASPWELIACRFLTGVGLGGAMPSGVALGGEYAPRRWRSTFITWMYCGYSLGMMGSGFAASALLASYGWQSVMLVGGILPILAALILLAWLPESVEFLINRAPNQPRAHARARAILLRIDPALPTAPLVAGRPSDQATGVTDLFTNRRGLGTLAIWLGFGMNLLVYFFLQSWLPTIFIEAGMSQDAAIQATAIAFGGGILAAFLIGPLMDRMGPYRIMGTLFVAGAAFVALLGAVLHMSVPIVVSAAFCIGFCASGLQKSIQALVVYFYPTALRSTGLGWGLGIGRIGAIAGPLIAGGLMQMGSGAPAVFYFMAFPMAIGAGCIFVMGRRYGKPGNDAGGTVPAREAPAE
jgi:AAHS family 4-hydroxybenzoate transporter-like MFS transporter